MHVNGDFECDTERERQREDFRIIVHVLPTIGPSICLSQLLTVAPLRDDVSTLASHHLSLHLSENDQVLLKIGMTSYQPSHL